MTASEARQITNKVREDNANSAMEEIIEKSEEKIQDAAEVGSSFVVVEIKIFMVDEELLKQRIYSYFKQLGYKIKCSIYNYMGYKYFQITIDWEEQ